MSTNNPTSRIVDRTYEEIRVGSWDEARRELQKFGDAWVFRGHSDAAWVLETSLEREHDFQIPRDVAEQKMLAEFQRRAHHFLVAAQLPSEDLEWLALMQHYGAPTRLLDWTRSPFVAAYFAVERVAKGSACAVWCLNQDWCVERTRDILRGVDPSIKAMCNPSDPEVFEKHIRPGTHRLVVPVEPLRLNERMTTQQGLFTCGGDPDVTFLDNLRALGASELPTHLVKLVIGGAARGDALDELNQSNVNRATLFPGIDGLAQSLKFRLIQASSLRRAYRRVGIR